MAIALGCAWFDELRDVPDILAEVDYVEVAGWQLLPEFERPHQRLVLHNLDQDWSMAAIDAIYPSWPDRLHQAIRTTRTPWFSMHLGFAAELVRFDNHMHPVSEPLDRSELMARIVEVTNEARLHCPLQILLENLDYCPEGAYEHVCEPSFIAEVIEMTGAGLLLDIAHWQVSASWLDFNPVDALAALPLDRVVEIHLSSPRQLEVRAGLLDDCHEALVERDLALLDTVLQQTNPRAVTLEYRRDMAQLRRQIAQLRPMLQEYTVDGSG